MNRSHESTHAELLAGFVQPRYRQDRDDIVGTLRRTVETGQGSYPQVVDPTVLEVGDEITVIRAIETLPLWKAVITDIIADTSVSGPDVMIFTEPPERLSEAVTGLIPEDFTGQELGLAELSPDGSNLPKPYFSYRHVFLSGTTDLLGTEPQQPQVTTTEQTHATLPDGWWGWDV